MERAGALLDAGHTVILDATFLREDSREEARAVARRFGAPVLFVQTWCPDKTVVGRMRRRGQRQTISDAGIDVYRRMKRRFVPPTAGGDLVRIDTRQPIRTSLAAIERALLHI